MGTVQVMMEEIKTELKNGATLEEIQDRAGEFVESHLPIYNNHIVQEWQDMPSEYDNRGYEELGWGQDINIINLMSLDLYLYYSDLFQTALEGVRVDLEEIAS